MTGVQTCALPILLTKVNFLILDEPTNHLDIPSREILEDALASFEGTILAVSHDRYFINKLSTRILSFDGLAVKAFEGNYQEYLDYQERLKNGTAVMGEAVSSVKTESMTDAKAKYLASKQAAAEKRKLENRYKKLTVEIEKAEKELEDNTLECETTAALDHVRLTELYQRNEELEEMLLTMWEERDILKAELDI